MDAYELFQKLSSGAKFDKKRFLGDAQRFQVLVENFQFQVIVSETFHKSCFISIACQKTVGK